MGQRLSRRFVAGVTLEEVLAAAGAMNRAGIAVSIDHLGENVTNADEARTSAAIYHRILDEIKARGLNANVSVKLTHMGLDVDEKICRDLICSIVSHAARQGNFIRVDMESSAYTQRTLDIVRDLHRQLGDVVGAVIQSYLRRSESDVETLLAEGIRIRLCKGAYDEPASVAFQKKYEVDANFMRLMKMLLKSGIYHGIATHDPLMIQETVRFSDQENISPDAFEFQMLYGIRRDLQQQLVREGWRLRAYIPFGPEWYPYFMRRLAERPANVLFLAKNILRG
ncbi:MAG: proline dehydrogenase family protein [Terriglobales bacterium]